MDYDETHALNCGRDYEETDIFDDSKRCWIDAQNLPPPQFQAHKYHDQAACRVSFGLTIPQKNIWKFCVFRNSESVNLGVRLRVMQAGEVRQIRRIA